MLLAPCSTLTRVSVCMWVRPWLNIFIVVHVAQFPKLVFRPRAWRDWVPGPRFSKAEKRANLRQVLPWVPGRGGMRRLPVLNMPAYMCSCACMQATWLVGTRACRLANTQMLPEQPCMICIWIASVCLSVCVCVSLRLSVYVYACTDYHSFIAALIRYYERSAGNSVVEQKYWIQHGVDDR